MIYLCGTTIIQYPAAVLKAEISALRLQIFDYFIVKRRIMSKPVF